MSLSRPAGYDDMALLFKQILDIMERSHLSPFLDPRIFSSLRIPVTKDIVGSSVHHKTDEYFHRVLAGNTMPAMAYFECSTSAGFSSFQILPSGKKTHF